MSDRRIAGRQRCLSTIGSAAAEAALTRSEDAVSSAAIMNEKGRTESVGSRRRRAFGGQAGELLGFFLRSEVFSDQQCRADENQTDSQR